MAADLDEFCEKALSEGFNPQPRVAADVYAGEWAQKEAGFNPQPRVAADLLQALIPRLNCVSIHSRAWRLTPILPRASYLL